MEFHPFCLSCPAERGEEAVRIHPGENRKALTRRQGYFCRFARLNCRYEPAALVSQNHQVVGRPNTLTHWSLIELILKDLALWIPRSIFARPDQSRNGPIGLELPVRDFDRRSQ